MSRKLDTLLVICALEMACLNRNPDRGLLFHSERGIQYIEIFYNRKRLHSYLGYSTPEEFKKNSFGLSQSLSLFPSRDNFPLFLLQ